MLIVSASGERSLFMPSLGIVATAILLLLECEDHAYEDRQAWHGMSVTASGHGG